MFIFKCPALATVHTQAINELPLLSAWQPPLAGCIPGGDPSDTRSCHSRHEISATCYIIAVANNSCKPG